MPDRSVDLRLFRYALASAEHGSFRKAAAALNVQQSTVSRGVRSLEHRVGAELFERGHAGIRPTQAGDRFLEEAMMGFDHLRRAMQRVGAFQRGEQGEITIGVAVPFALMSDVFERFREGHPGVSVEIIESTSSASWALVQKRTLDVAFVARCRGHGAPRSLHLRNEGMSVVLPTTHPLAGARKLTLEELRLERVILCAGGLGPDIEDHLVRRMARWGVEPMVQMHRVDQWNLINMVAMGFGVTIAIGPVPQAATGGVALVPLAGKDVFSVHAVWMECNPNPVLKGLLDIARRSVRQSIMS